MEKAWKAHMAFYLASGELIYPYLTQKSLKQGFSELKMKLWKKDYMLLSPCSKRKPFDGLIVFGESRKQIKADMNSAAKQVGLPFYETNMEDFIEKYY